MRDPYYVLGLGTNASKDEVKKKYRELAKKWHPDLVKGAPRDVAEKTFREITEAYKSICDESAPTPSRSGPGSTSRPTYWAYGTKAAGEQAPPPPRYKVYEYSGPVAQDASLWSQWTKLGRQERLAFGGMGVICAVWLAVMYWESDVRVSRLYDDTAIAANAGSKLQKATTAAGVVGTRGRGAAATAAVSAGETLSSAE